MNSFNNFSGHLCQIPEEWLPKPPVQVKPSLVKESDALVGVVEYIDENAIKGKSTMSRAKQKAYERMLANIAREEEAARREKNRLENLSAEEERKEKEAEQARLRKIVEDRENAIIEREERKREREGAALRKRREQDARALAFKLKEEQRVIDELASKTKHSYELKGEERPDGRLRNREVKQKSYMYFGDYATVGKEKNDELKERWGPHADPDLYFWVPHGYGEFRDHQAEMPFMEGEMVSGVMTGIGAFRLQDEDGELEYKGLFSNDRPQGFGQVRRTGIEGGHGAVRLAVYQRGKQICYLDELRPGARIKLYGSEHGDLLSDARKFGAGARPSMLPVMPHSKTPYREATILDAAGGPGVFRVKPDFANSFVVNLRSTLWDLVRQAGPLFQGVEMMTGEADDTRFHWNPRGFNSDISDGRENFFGPSSAIRLEGEKQAAKADKAATQYLEYKAMLAATKAGEDKAQKEKDDRKEARKLARAEKKKEAADRKEEEEINARIGTDYERRLASRQRALEESRSGGLQSAPVEDDGKPFKPNSGRMLFDDGRWNFIPNMRSITEKIEPPPDISQPTHRRDRKR